MKTAEILLEVAKEQGIESAEKVIMDAFKILEEAAPKLLLADDSAGKIIGTGLSIVLPAIKGVVEKMADLNKDGKIG
jgi:hypothetical protein